MMKAYRLLWRMRQWLNSKGWDVLTYRKFIELLPLYEVDFVVDVGANVGQYASEVRRLGYSGEILSFEPCSEPYQCLKEVSAADQAWRCMNAAAGEFAEDSVSIRVYRESVFSSMKTLQVVDMDYQEESIKVIRLDDVLLADPQFMKASRPFLKVDTQGFDEQVLLGATESLKRCIGVQLECSLSPLYEGQWTIEDAIRFMRNAGFTPWSVKRGFIQDHREFELDMIFYREDIVSTAKV